VQLYPQRGWNKRRSWYASLPLDVLSSKTMFEIMFELFDLGDPRLEQSHFRLFSAVHLKKGEVHIDNSFIFANVAGRLDGAVHTAGGEIKYYNVKQV
jgi:hypothetical protein